MIAPGAPVGCGYAAAVNLMDNSSSYPQAPQLLGQRFALTTCILKWAGVGSMDKVLSRGPGPVGRSPTAFLAFYPYL